MSGYPGVGKTSLMRALVERARAGAGAVLWGSWDEREAPVPYWTWVNVLRELAGERGDGLLAPLFQRELAGVPPRHLTAPAAARASALELEAHRSVPERLLAHARTSPLVLALDNLHATDRASLRLLETSPSTSPCSGSSPTTTSSPPPPARR